MRSGLIFLPTFPLERTEILFLSVGAVSDPSGPNPAMSLDSPAVLVIFTPPHISVFSQIVSFSFSSLLTHFLSVDSCPPPTPFAAPVACATKVQTSLVSAEVNGERGDSPLPLPTLPGISGWGNKDLSSHKSFLGWRGGALSYVPEKVIPGSREREEQTFDNSCWHFKALLNTMVMENFL